MAQLVERPALDLGLGLDLGIVNSGPMVQNLLKKIKKKISETI